MIVTKYSARARAVGCGLALALAAAAAAHAQSGRDALIAPIEVLTCRFAADKGPADLDGLARAFNQWMEKYSAPEYAAYALTPMAHSKEIDFDLAWVGVWPDGTTMGSSMAHWFEHGDELGPVFGGVLTCGTNTNFQTVTLREPAEAGRFGPVEVATCTLRLGATLEQALDAAKEWVDHTATTGSTAAHWLLFPAYGEHSDARYNFKWAIGYESYEAFGRDYDQATNGNSLDRYNELFSPLVRCDSPRLYRVRTIRAPQR
jgi:hypothetical protein